MPSKSKHTKVQAHSFSYLSETKKQSTLPIFWEGKRFPILFTHPRWSGSKAQKGCKYRQMDISISLHLPHSQQDTCMRTPTLTLLLSAGIWRCCFVCVLASDCLSSLPVSGVFYSGAVFPSGHLNQCMTALFPPTGPQCKWTWPMSHRLDGKELT